MDCIFRRGGANSRSVAKVTAGIIGKMAGRAVLLLAAAVLLARAANVPDEFREFEHREPL